MVLDNCKQRIKPMLLRDVKTEALLVFARTALERYFTQLEAADYTPVVGTPSESAYVYDTLRTLLQELQACVVNIDYLLELAQSAQSDPRSAAALLKEEPLIAYYNAMAHEVEIRYQDRPAFLPELLVVCALSDWILEAKHSVSHYPFVRKVDFTELISIFEANRREFEKDGVDLVAQVQEIALRVTARLKKKKYKVKRKRGAPSRRYP